jgi:hypothetical protein
VTGNPVAAQSLICDLHTVAVVHGSDNHMFVQIHQPESNGLAMLVIRAAGKRQPLAVLAPNDRGERRLPAGLGRFRD